MARVCISQEIILITGRYIRIQAKLLSQTRSNNLNSLIQLVIRALRDLKTQNESNPYDSPCSHHDFMRVVPLSVRFKNSTDQD